MTGSNEARHRGTGPRRRLAPFGVVAAVVAMCVALGPAAWAVFTDSATVTAGTAPTTAFTSGTLGAPGTPTRAQASGTAPVVLTWAAAAVTWGGTGTVAPAGYDVYRATGDADTGSLVCSTTTSLTCNDTAASIPSGSRYYVRAKLATSWVRDSARLTYADNQPPVLSATQPTTGLSLGGGLLAGRVEQACGASAVACGPAGDTGGIATSITYRLVRGGSQCWNGTSWAASACTGNAFQTASTGGPVWRIPGSPSTAYVSLIAGFDLTVRVTDGAGNQATLQYGFSTLL